MNKIEFNINNIIYKCKSLSELTLDNYNLLFSILSEQDDEVLKVKKVLHILADIPFDILDNINLTSFYQIDFKSILNEEIKSKSIKNTYKIKGTTYNLQNLNKITFGRYVDADFFLTSKDNATKKIQNVVACMLLPDKYSIEDLNSLSNKLKDLNISILLTIFNYYSDFRLDIIQKYPNLFEQSSENTKVESLYDKTDKENPLDNLEFEDEEEDEIEENPWGWQGVIYSLCNDDITKIDKITNKGLIETLEFLSYRKFQYDEQMKINKRT